MLVLLLLSLFLLLFFLLLLLLSLEEEEEGTVGGVGPLLLMFCVAVFVNGGPSTSILVELLDPGEFFLQIYSEDVRDVIK